LIDSFILRSLLLRILLLDVVYVSYSCSVFKDLCTSPSEECCINIPSIRHHVNVFYHFFQYFFRASSERKFQDISQSFFDFLEKYLFFYERNLVLLHFRVICIACRYILSI